MFIMTSESDNGHTSCLMIVSISKEASTDCDNSTWVNGSCDLNNILSIITQVVPDDLDCIEIRLMPGRHIIKEAHTLRTNIILNGENGVIVTFDMSKEYLASVNHSSGNPLYVLSFRDVDYVELSSIVFHNSPGLIGFDNIHNVRVVKSTFT